MLIFPCVRFRFLVAAMVVSPFIDTAPVPVEKVPELADMLKFPEVWVYPVIFSKAPAFVNLEVDAVESPPSARLRLATLVPFVFSMVNVEVPA